MKQKIPQSSWGILSVGARIKETGYQQVHDPDQLIVPTNELSRAAHLGRYPTDSRFCNLRKTPQRYRQ